MQNTNSLNSDGASSTIGLTSDNCHKCYSEFNPKNRSHHCRLCGNSFCHDCSSHRSLIPPSSIVLPKTGKTRNHHKNTHNKGNGHGYVNEVSTSNEDLNQALPNSPYERTSPEVCGADSLLYGRGLEERYKLAREPLRVCDTCCLQLEPIQHELRASNSNAVRYNSIDPTDIKRLFNSPLAFTLGHEVRKAAYTLNNLLPLPKRGNLIFSPSKELFPLYNDPYQNPIAECKSACKTISPSLGDLDGVRIPARLLEQAKGIAVLTIFKGGFVFGGEFGSGLVVAKLGQNGEEDDANNVRWSAPSSIGAIGVSWGALAGAQVSDHVFLLMTDDAVELMATSEGSFQLGADIGVAVGPLGRAFEANLGATKSSGTGAPAVAPIYTYSPSKGFYAGVSLDGKVILTRHRVNEKFYGCKISPTALLSGEVPSPPAAQPLYDALRRCHVYVTNSGNAKGVAANISTMCGGQPSQSSKKTDEDGKVFHYRDERPQSMTRDEWDTESSDFAPVELPSPQDHRDAFRIGEFSDMSMSSTSEYSF